METELWHNISKTTKNHTHYVENKYREKNNTNLKTHTHKTNNQTYGILERIKEKRFIYTY